MGHRIISCFCKKLVVTGKLQSNVDFVFCLGGGPPIFNFPLCLYQKHRELSNPPELLFLGQVVILGKHPPVAAGAKSILFDFEKAYICV